MEPMYDHTDLHSTVIATGGSVANFDRKQAIFFEDMDCDDSITFAKAVEKVSPAPANDPTARDVKCSGKCKRPENRCIKTLQKLFLDAKEAADAVRHARREEVKDAKCNKSNSPYVPQVLFPGEQFCGGCSRSPAWDAIELPSQWFAGYGPIDMHGVSRVPATNLSKLLDVPHTTGFVVVDTWETKVVRKLDGTISHSTMAPAWHLTRSELQCMDDSISNSEATANQSIYRQSSSGHEIGIFEYRGYIPLLGCAQDELSYQMYSIGLLRNGRVLNNIMCSVELYHTAAKLLEMRDSTMIMGSDTRVGGLRTSTKAASFPKLRIKGPLPPKLSGYATCPTSAYNDLCDRERVSGGMRNTSLFAMALGYDRGVYGGSIAGLWALMDSAFMFDYSTGKYNLDLAEKISNTYITVRGHDTGNPELNAHLLDIVTVVGCNFTALKAKAALEDSRQGLQSKPCVAIWDDLAAMARYRLADAVFCHVWYDCPGDEASLVMVGMGCAVHDLIDIGPDVSCGEISNIIPSLTKGDLSLEALWSVYVGLVAALEWYAANDPFNPAALAILFTHWWQLDNLRHRTVALMSRIEPSPEFAVCPEKLTSPPAYRTFTHENGLSYQVGQKILDSQRAELDRIENLDFQDVQGVIRALVRPVLDYADGKDTHLPIEVTYCADVLEACLSRKHSEKIKLLWQLMLIMWKCGAMWNVVLASTQYSHQGLTNCDRGRDDYNETTWAQTVPCTGSQLEEREERPKGLQWLLSKLRQLFVRH